MSRKTGSWVLFGASLLAFAPLFGNWPQRSPQEFSDAAEAARLRRAASETLQVPLENVEFRSEVNLIGFRSKEILFSRRTDSRTYFVQDLRPAHERGEQFYRGSDEDFLQRLRAVFKSLEVPANEIAQARVLQEQMQEARVDRATGKLVQEERRPGKRWATASRSAEGLSVFSSRALLGLDGGGRIDFLELHWPTIPQDTLAEAHRLEFKIREGWRPPALDAAHVESVEAGVVHSPAIAFVMDFHPAIRVIYAPNEKGHGKKAVRYFDRNGRDIPAPRQFGTPPEEGRGTQRSLREPRKE